MDDDRAAQHEQWATMRAHAPVYRDEPSKSFVLTRYADVRALVMDPNTLRDPDLAEDGAVVHQFKGDGPERDAPMTWKDGPEHVRVRAPLQRALYTRVAAARPAIEAIVHALLDTCAERAAFDAVTDFAIPIPVDAIGAVLGVATQDLQHFRAWSEAMMLAFHPARSPAQDAAMLDANANVAAYIDSAIAARRLRPRDDLISDMVLAQKDGLPLSDTELRVNCMTLLTGGNMTTADLIGSAILLLLRNPQERVKLQENPALVASAIEETLRFAPPVDGTQRILESDRTIAGCPMKKGQVVAVQLPSANRDAAMFADPDRFDITRRPNPHVSFGGGAHICLGAPLARLEAQVAIDALFVRFPNLHLAGPPPRWRVLPYFHGLDSLPVAI